MVMGVVPGLVIYPPRDAISPTRERGKTAFVEGFSLKRPFSLLAWEKTYLAGVEDRGSLISVPLALRVRGGRGFCLVWVLEGLG